MIFSIALMVIAGAVAYGQWRKLPVWPLICIYWSLLTVKYAVELWLR